MISVFY